MTVKGPFRPKLLSIARYSMAPYDRTYRYTIGTSCVQAGPREKYRKMLESGVFSSQAMLPRQVRSKVPQVN